MRNYIILNDQNSNDISGLLIQSLAPISKPLMRTEIEEIDGRDGDIITPLGFSAYDKQITIGLYGTYDINAIIAFFNSEGTVTFSNEPDKYYNYTIFQQIDFERLVRFRTATVTLHCQPFKFATTGETQTLDSGDPVSDEGTNLVLEGSQLAPFSQFDLKGNTVQDGTPTPDAPVPVQVVTGENTVKIRGKNSLKLPSAGTNDGVTYSVNSDGTFNVHGTNNSGYEILFSLYLDSSEFQSVNYTLGAREALPYGLGCRCEIYSGGTWKRSFVSVNYTRQTQTGTPDFTDANRVRVAITIANGATVNIDNVGIQLEKGSSASSFEPYQEQSYEVNLGKNLLPYPYAGTGNGNGITFTSNSDGSMVLNGQNNGNGNSSYIFFNNSDEPLKLSSGTYYFAPPSNTAVGYTMYDGSHYYNFSAGNNYSRTFSSAQSIRQIYIQVARGNTTTFNNLRAYPMLTIIPGQTEADYAPYFEPIELCKIGTYQDYIWKDGDTWKIHKETTTFTLDGTKGGYYSSWFYIPFSGIGVTNVGGSNTPPAFSSQFIAYGYNTFTGDSSLNGMAQSSTNFLIRNTSCSSEATYKTWLGSNLPRFYYALATPTDTTITNAALIEQLEAIANQAHAYKTRTHVSSTYATGNVPHIIAATVVGDASGTITNAGNIYSKPKLTVYGSGDIGIYLNGVQMFQIALGSDGYITIDTNLMEAYKDNLQTLKNRQVTGDYSNFKLPVGQSTISFSGIVTSCVVENFSRWL